MSYCNIKEGIDIEERERLRAPDAAQLILTIYTFVGTLLLKIKYTNCVWDWLIWVDILFYGSLVWLAYLLISLVGKYKDRNVRYFFKVK